MIIKHTSGEIKYRSFHNCFFEDLDEMHYRLVFAALLKLQDAAGARGDDHLCL